jgi:hypothetical protein
MCARPVGPGVSPLDEALGLSGSRYSPKVLSWLARLGANAPFAEAAALLADLTGIRVSAATVRRQSEALGATVVALAEAEVERIEQEWPVPPVAPDRLVTSVDGAMIPLRHGEWAEMKLVSVGEPEPAARAAPGAEGDPAAGVRTRQLSYFARLSDAETFGRQALGELHRRGLERAGAVAAVQDGAVWLQGFMDFHRPDALRILDWPHAAQRLTAIAEQLFGVNTPRSRQAGARLRQWLWSEGPRRVLAVLACWERHQPAIGEDVAYLRERQAQLTYPAFRQQGWPVGSGATESAHKTVMQARMKRAGMHWAREQVNPLLALRLLDRNGRWTSEGPQFLSAHSTRCLQQRRRRQHARRLVRCPAPVPLPLAVPPSPAPPPSPFRHPWRRYGVPLSAKN